MLQEISDTRYQCIKSLVLQEMNDATNARYLLKNLKNNIKKISVLTLSEKMGLISKGYIEHKANKLSTYKCKAKYINYEIMITLECEINVPAGINMPAGKVYENNKHASCWKI